MNESILPVAKHRRVRSFVRREGRLTPGQQRAMNSLWPHYGLSTTTECLDLDAVFGRQAPRILEIGFGNGAALIALAAAHPEQDYLGIEVHRPGVGALLLAVETQTLKNVRVICADAVEVLTHALPDASLAGIQIFFPDPWHKQRHHKRRLIQAEFAALLTRKLAVGSGLHVATDWRDYAQQILGVLDATPHLANNAGTGQFSPRPEQRPVTRFEQRGQGLGHAVFDLIYTRLTE